MELTYKTVLIKPTRPLSFAPHYSAGFAEMRKCLVDVLAESETHFSFKGERAPLKEILSKEELEAVLGGKGVEITHWKVKFSIGNCADERDFAAQQGRSMAKALFFNDLLNAGGEIY